jgi:hypothetical protein
MNIYKLIFKDQAEAELTLMAKSVIDTDLSYINGTQAVVYIGVLDEVTQDYCVDVMTADDIDFGSNEIFPVNCLHAFSGYAIDAEGKVDAEK